MAIESSRACIANYALPIGGKRMQIENRSLYNEAYVMLKEIYGQDAEFRQGQYEAIEATIQNKRTLIVQKTGWGKSLVYFICTKLKRKHSHGMTIVISPLLVLMENQIYMARKMGLKCEALNSTVKDKAIRNAIFDDIRNNTLDMLFITPETLLKDEIQQHIHSFRIGLFVIDEAHCISDWGHDFRLDYRKIGRIVSGAFSTVSVLATTATANDRVIRDLKQQLGNDVYISTGPLTRESLHIQILRLGKRSERYAWLLENIPKLPGTGIIYCLDRRDCDSISLFLQQHHISAKAYYSRQKQNEEERNCAAIDDFWNNRIKVIVATIKLGMGYDKNDISFIIHFQSPASIVAWYQQIGRAGRNIRDAYVFLMTGEEDSIINNYFIRTAFPNEQEANAVIEHIINSNGITKNELMRKINTRPARIEKALSFLENDGFIRRELIGKYIYYFSTAKNYVYDRIHYQTINNIRREEMKQMHQLTATTMCLSRFAANCLGDFTAVNCGKCANCIGHDIFPNLSISDTSRRSAFDFIISKNLIIEPRKKWPTLENIPQQFCLQPGICLAKYGEFGYGSLVAKCKYYQNDGSRAQFFDERLVTQSACILKNLIKEHRIKYITYVPSLRSNLVKDFAERLANKTDLIFIELLIKSQALPQKEMENSVFQYQNAYTSFSVKHITTQMPDKVLLVDDIVDSRWTLTVCGYKLLQNGCTEVYPFALADSSYAEE